MLDREPRDFSRGRFSEFTNYCKNDCYYCGIRRSNQNAVRYRLTKEEILLCCKIGYTNGLRTFVLQGGEDMYFSTEKMTDIVSSIKKAYPDCAVTLSVGEKDFVDYAAYFKAGADRFLLRHETADEKHYTLLHPSEMSFAHRMNCLKELKEIGYQVGAGMMIGSPYQTIDNLIADLKFLSEFKPHMIGIGPFIPHNQTPFRDKQAGSVELTLVILSIVRLLLPKVLLPATTALATLSENGTVKGLEAGANVIMPNISPTNIRNLYTLYNNKKITGGESLEGINNLKGMLKQYGYEVIVGRGDSLI
ncbi:[FeFe] hydrogenase H-cluster radical SAM maturase HydE [Megamonas hypermegale]|uniref:[FeFe] hydrogenase H-cluster radical SAM maturase HydE n=1 Tax=Megamonas hypermegale TaxID=158847 RepID=UPI0025A3D7BD|nr:[FeFe] hydrogenase H-cluster radical SAM maturase HydE [Megamonas hypermegale]MDM8142575.1 [FeFe] hydrogenase H-cluster radical SAM maturase HydE [Megamonas hypermegale]